MREYRDYRLVCQNCETTFPATREDAKYCSPRCRTAAHRKAKKLDLVNALDKETRESLWYLRDLSSLAYKLILVIYQRHGLDAAELALNACLRTYDNVDVTSGVTASHFGVETYEPIGVSDE